MVDTKDEKRLGDNAFYEPWWNMVDAGMADTPSASNSVYRHLAAVDGIAVLER